MQRAVTLSALALAALPLHAQADGWSFLPATQSGYEADAALAVLGGLQNPDVDEVDSDTAYGVELSLSCPTLAPPRGEIRQQISVTRFDNDGLEVTSFELNPHYLLDLGSSLALGVGPGLGYVAADAGGDSDGVFALQAGASLHYHRGPIFLGAEARYQWTQEAGLGGAETDVDNSRFLAKAGIRF
ncbi:MAG: porin family protein [Thiohalospira sp.]